MTVSYPATLVPSNVAHELRGFSVSGGRSNTGDEQRAFFSAGRWEFRYDIPVRTREKVLAARAMMDRLRTGEDVLLKVFDLQRAEGALGADPNAAVVSSVSAGATSMQIEASGLDPEPGVHFSIGQRLYRINRVTAETPSDSLVDIILSDDKLWVDSAVWVEDGSGGSTYSVNFLPPLRATASAGAAVDFTDLVCLCGLAEMSDGDLSLDLGKFGTLSIAFREA